MQSLPYWRLSGFYFFHFAFIGAFAPYWGLYLKSLSFNAFQIGVLMSLLHVMRIFAPTAWGWLADHTGRRMLVVQLAAITGLVSYCGVFFGESFFWLFIIMALMSFFLERITSIDRGNNSISSGRKYSQIREYSFMGFVRVCLCSDRYRVSVRHYRNRISIVVGVRI